MKQTKKLIEVALPLDAINAASVREAYIYRGNPSAVHKWWAQRPLAAARAVLFTQMVDDPSAYVETLLRDPKLRRKAEATLKARRRRCEDAMNLARRACEAGIEAPAPGEMPTLEDVVAEQERARLFRIIEELVTWENTTNEQVLQAARDEIWQSWRRACADNADHPRARELFDRRKLPAFHDPFAGGGSLPLEAQRLGLEAHASDLNPVAVLINKAMIEIPPMFAGRPPVNPEARSEKSLLERQWKGAQGLAEDVRYYGKWMRDEAERRIGHLYPKIQITAEMAKERPDLEPYLAQDLTVIAWLWARTVKSPNPAFADVQVPLVSTFMLSTKPGKEAYVDPVVENGAYRFTVKVGKPRNVEQVKRGTKLSQGTFQCLMSGSPFRYEYVDDEANAGRMGARLMAIVAEGKGRRVYLDPVAAHDAVARSAQPTWKPDAPSRGTWASNAQGRRYGFETFGDYFTQRQLVALTTFSDLLAELKREVRRDACEAGLADDPTPLRDGGAGSVAYAEALSLYLAFAQDKAAEYGCTLVPWYSKEDRPKGLFARQAIPMVWDFAEVNPLCNIGGSFSTSARIVAGSLEGTALCGLRGTASQRDAQQSALHPGAVVSTDPPYYDNIGYADLSDFFYVWLRRALRSVFPDLLATVAAPKADELVATPYRHGGKQQAEAFFLGGMTAAMHRLVEAHPAFPVTIYYAFKQSESESDEGVASTGWETFLAAVIDAGFSISGTWPMRTERGSRSTGLGSNALASSIVIVCRPRPRGAPSATRRELLAALKLELPRALAHLQRGNIAPVDLAQAAIGPGMAVFTRHEKVLDAEGKPLTVRDALALINQTLDEALAEQEGDFDADSRWALAWFEQNGFAEGEYGVAETLSTAKNTSVAGMVEAGIVESKRGKVRLLKAAELPADWNPATDQRLTAWEMVHHLIRVLEAGGERAAATLASAMGSKAETARELCYRLYTVCERRKRAAEALAYNALVQSWPEITRLAREGMKTAATDGDLFAEIEG